MAGFNYAIVAAEEETVQWSQEVMRLKRTRSKIPSVNKPMGKALQIAVSCSLGCERPR